MNVLLGVWHFSVLLWTRLHNISNYDLHSLAGWVAHLTANNKSIAVRQIFTSCRRPPIVLRSPGGRDGLACSAYAHTGYAQFSKCVYERTHYECARTAHCALFATYISRSIVSTARAARFTTTAATNHLLFASTRIIGIVCLHRRPARSRSPLKYLRPPSLATGPILWCRRRFVLFFCLLQPKEMH